MSATSQDRTVPVPRMSAMSGEDAVLFGARLLTPDDSDLAIAVTARLDEAVAEGWLGPRLPDPREYVRVGAEPDRRAAAGEP